MDTEFESYKEYCKRLGKESAKKRHILYKTKHPEIMEAHKIAKSLPRNPGMHLHHWSYGPRFYKDVIELTPSDHKYIHKHLTYDNIWYCFKIKGGKRLGSKKSHLEYINNILGNRNNNLIMLQDVTK